MEEKNDGGRGRLLLAISKGRVLRVRTDVLEALLESQLEERLTWLGSVLARPRSLLT